jgi:hypothetical protein
MSNGTKVNSENSTAECVVCYAAHDDEIHAATLRIHRWFHGQVTRNIEDPSSTALALQPEIVAA